MPTRTVIAHPGRRPPARLLVGLLLLIVAAAAGAQDFQQAAFEFPATLEVRYHQSVPMRDGVGLATDVYLPNGEGQFPTLLVRDIYSSGTSATRESYARFATANGYAFVFQSARGRYDSAGNWYPYFQEINDGDDTLSWIAAQPWSDGKVGMFGTSYLASVQWLAALNRNPALKAIAPAMSPGNYYRDVAYPGGAFSLLSRARWGIGIVGSRTSMMYPRINWAESIGHLPIETLGERLGFSVRHFQDWLAHPRYDAYWEPLNLEARANEMTVPALNIGGWYDVFLRSTLGSYSTMSTQAASDTARKNQRLLIGPWPHGWNQSRRTGEVDFGDRALIDVAPLLLEWFDHWLKDGPPPAGAPVRLFVMGENRWRDEAQWPLPDTDYQPWFLHADGRLGRDEPASEAALSYVYDPADPVPTLGGNIMDPALRGPFDQRPLDERRDIHRFVSEPFSEATEITGPVRAVLFAESDAVDTDFMVKLSVVKADGAVYNLVDGVLRARFREGFEEERLIEPGQVYRYDIDLWATSYRVAPGERLRVDVTSSNFPRLARNLNTGAPFAKTAVMRPAKQTLRLSGAHPSRVILPVVAR